MSVIKGFNILSTNKQLETCLMPVAKAGDRETEIERKYKSIKVVIFSQKHVTNK